MPNYFILQAKLVEGETLSWGERVCNKLCIGLNSSGGRLCTGIDPPGGGRERKKFICHISHNQYNNNFTQRQAARKENSITAGHL